MYKCTKRDVVKIHYCDFKSIIFVDVCPNTTAHFRNTDLPNFIYEQQIYDDNVSMIVFRLASLKIFPKDIQKKKNDLSIKSLKCFN